MGIGAQMLNSLLEYWIICSEKNQWPGYSIFLQPDWKGQRIGYPVPPGWYNQQSFEFFDK